MRWSMTGKANRTGTRNRIAGRESSTAKRTRTAHVVALAVASACQPGDRPAEMILTGGRIYTVDNERPWAEAVAVRDGVILFVGDSAGAEELASAETRRIDLNGRLVLPGFTDAHVHPLSGYELALAPARTPDQVFEAIRAYAALRPDEEWVEGYGWDLTLFPETGPTREQLDRLVPDRPAMLWGGDGHSLWVNSQALEAAGIDRTTPDPEGGRIERDATGEPSGTLREAAATRMEAAAPQWSTEKRIRALRRSLESMARFGISAFLDAAVDDDTMLEAYRQASRRDMLTAHAAISLAVPRESAELDIEKLVGSFVALRSTDTFPDVSVQAAKIFVDGVIEAGTAAMIEPYTGTTSRGNLLRPPAVLEPLVAALRAEGFQLHFHAIGDGAIRVVLDALERTATAGIPIAPAPPLIAHAQLVDPADVARFARTGAVPVFSAVWAYEDSYIRDLTVPRLGPERSRRIYAIRTLHEAGARITLGSDWPVTTMDPLQAIEVAVTRVDPDSPDAEADAFLPEQRIDIRTAIEAATLASARAIGRADVSGSIAVGKRADLIVLSENIFEIPASAIGSARVLLTLYGGRDVFRDSAFEDDGSDD
jgi:hypothetical protein